MSELESLAVRETLPVHLTRHGIDRLVMLSDGVFAIAITLAAIEIHVPAAPSVTAVIAAMNVSLIAYFISFVVIAVFLASNRDLFARLERVDRPLTALVLATLCLTALIPASVRVTNAGQGALGGAFQFYALLMVLSGALNLALWIYASCRRDLMSNEVSRNYRIKRAAETATLPLLFMVIFLVPTVAALKWVAALVVVILVLRRVVLGRLFADESPVEGDG